MGLENFYHDEIGLMVFTAHYLLSRGYCCDNGCRHCPYRGPSAILWDLESALAEPEANVSLRALTEMGCRVFLLTSQCVHDAQREITSLGLANYITAIYGPEEITDLAGVVLEKEHLNPDTTLILTRHIERATRNRLRAVGTLEDLVNLVSKERAEAAATRPTHQPS